MPHQDGAYPGFCSIKRLRVFLLPLGWDARYPFIHLGGERHCGSKSVLPKNTTQCPRPGPEPGPLALESSTLTMGPPRLPHCCTYILLLLVFYSKLRSCKNAGGGSDINSHPASRAFSMLFPGVKQRDRRGSARRVINSTHHRMEN